MSSTVPPHVTELVAGFRAGDRRSLARAFSLIESSTPADHHAVTQLFEALPSPAGPTRRIGVTGAPGVGKSTFLDAFGLELIRKGHRVAVLAIDPTSARSGGSILGDKVRMQHLSQDDRAFIRPSPSRHALGGVAPSTSLGIALCEAAGYDTVIVETVGVGQSEIDVASMVDLFILLALPTAGDDVQGIKRGIMEVADLIVVTKADLDATAARRAAAMYSSVLRLFMPATLNWNASASVVSALSRDGFPDLLERIDEFFDQGRQMSVAERRLHQRIQHFDTMLMAALNDRIRSSPEIQQVVQTFRDRIANGQVIPHTAVQRLVESLNITIAQP
jgi:LAO/AO transport system kinase